MPRYEFGTALLGSSLFVGLWGAVVALRGVSPVAHGLTAAMFAAAAFWVLYIGD
jgi:hypothetical protein